jgi:hypothetical protein
MRASGSLCGSADTELVVVYDLSVTGAWDMACRHARWWGRHYVELSVLDDNHIALVCRPAGDERWRAWERVRAEWIREELAA